MVFVVLVFEKFSGLDVVEGEVSRLNVVSGATFEC